MKKITLFLMITFVLLTFNPITTKSETRTATVETTLLVPEKPVSAEAKVLLQRLDEINAIDKSDLKSSEKRALRKEVRSIKKNLREAEGGIYFSLGAIIIILILLIILL